MNDQDKITYLAETDFRNKKIKFGIKAKDRTRHIYIIGKTGMGKSTLLENMAVQDIQNGEGVAFIDPHGGTAEKLLDYIPEDRIKDTIYFAPFDTDYPISFNVMEDVGPDKRHLVANGLMNAFKKIWVDAWSARMEYILNNVLLALLEYPDATILGVNRMLSDKDYRNLVVANVSDASVRAFWVDEFAKYGDKYMQEAGAAIQNKIGQFVSNPLIRNIIGQPKSTFDVRDIMDKKKILIMNLSKGRMGIENSSLLGNMLVTKVYLGAMSRADATAAELQVLPNFYFYVDEFQSFANESFADILSEARKYKLSLTIAHQYVNQMPEEVRDAVFGNVGSMVTFRIGPEDAELFEKEFAPEFLAEDLVNLGFSQVYLRLMIDGIGSKPFSATTLPPISIPAHSFKGEIIEATRKTHATPRKEVEEAINIWYTPIAPKITRKKSESDLPAQASDSTRKERSPSAKPKTHHDVWTRDMEENRPIEAPKPTPPPTPVVSEKTPIIAEKPVKTESINPVQPDGGRKGEIREEKKVHIPRESSPSVPQPYFHEKTTPVSLSQLASKKKEGPSKNSMALKEALAAALKDKAPAGPEPKTEEPKNQPGMSNAGSQKETVSAPETSTVQNAPLKNIPTDGGLAEESKKWDELKKENKTPDAPREIPEDVLRNLLKE